LGSISTSKQAAADAILAKDHSDAIASAEFVAKEPYPNPPISVRLSEPLLERLDRLAALQHRKRGNLIQHILWEYVRAHDE
jgi:hypothetical protein